MKNLRVEFLYLLPEEQSTGFARGECVVGILDDDSFKRVLYERTPT